MKKRILSLFLFSRNSTGTRIKHPKADDVTVYSGRFAAATAAAKLAIDLYNKSNSTEGNYTVYEPVKTNAKEYKLGNLELYIAQVTDWDTASSFDNFSYSGKNVYK